MSARFAKNRTDSSRSAKKIADEFDLAQEADVPISFAPVNFDKIKDISYLNISCCRLSNDNFCFNLSEPAFHSF